MIIYLVPFINDFWLFICTICETILNFETCNMHSVENEKVILEDAFALASWHVSSRHTTPNTYLKTHPAPAHVTQWKLSTQDLCNGSSIPHIVNASSKVANGIELGLSAASKQAERRRGAIKASAPTVGGPNAKPARYAATHSTAG